jgi:signal transduction histidine kinase
MEWEGSEGLIFSIIGLIGLCAIIIFLFIVFQKKKNVLILKQIEAEKYFEKEIVESQIEIREQTLRNISWELHDNIGQLLTLAKIQLQRIPEHPEAINDVNDNLGNILSEVRALSRIISPDFISNVRLVEALQLEIDRFNRLNFIQSELVVQGTPQTLDSKVEIVIFRIMQEFFSNVIKHSKASKLTVNLNFTETTLIITATDNGIGYNTRLKANSGLGISNMKKRGKLINAEINITSEIDTGTTLTIRQSIN